MLTANTTVTWSLPGELNSVYILTRDACCRYHQAGMSWVQVRSAGLEPAITWLSTMPVYLFAARAQESRHPVPTRAIRRTKAEPQPCAAAKLPSLDSNQEPLGSEPSAAAG